MSTIVNLCEQLADAHEAKGIAVRSTLQPGLRRDDILAQTASLGFALPESIVELYAWHNGHGFTEPWHEGPALRFRDTAFLSFEVALTEYRELQSYREATDSTLSSDGIDLRTSFPIAQIQGVWLVVACGEHLYGNDKTDVVVSVYHDIELYFYSVESMLKTCLAWVSHPAWNENAYELLPDGIERDIWQRFNPGIRAAQSL